MSDEERLRRQIERERRARHEAEAIAERTTRALYDRQRELELLEAVATASNEAANVEEAVQVALTRIGQHTGWPVGHAYVPEDDRLVSLGVWHLPDAARFAEFRTLSEQACFAPGVGLPGRVWATAEPYWLADVRTDPNFPRRDAAWLAGLRAGFAFPVVTTSGVAAVLEFFTEAPVEPDHGVLRVLAGAGAHVGRLIERQRAEVRIRHQALHDALTGLPNRTLFANRLEAALQRAGLAGEHVAVLFVDLDRFKTVNDGLGHGAGDRLLLDVGSRLTGAMRTGDTVARFGGDEFTILCERLTGEEGAVQVAQRLLEALAEPLTVAGRELYVSASIGIALGDHPERMATIVEEADAALYRAKELGRGRWEVYDNALRAQANARIHLEADLRRAVTAGELWLAYQPLVGVRGREVRGVEALLRWDHPELGPVPPDVFVPVAEDIGLIDGLSAWVLEQACLQHRAWGEPITLGVNLSPRQLERPALAAEVGAILRQTGMPPHLLCLEITETVLMRDVVESVDVLEQLGALGVRLAIDDFGTGYSSLGSLKRLPVHVLKLDRSLVAEIATDPAQRAIAAAAIDVAHAFGLTALAEGVEETAQLDVLARLGCDEAQGYLFSRPVPAAELSLGVDVVVAAPAAVRR